MRAARFATSAILLIIVLLGVDQVPTEARASYKLTSAPFEIRYDVNTSARFTVTEDGRVTATSRATGGALYFVQVGRENCGSFGCHGWTLVGGRATLRADGLTRTVTSRRAIAIVFTRSGSASQTMAA